MSAVSKAGTQCHAGLAAIQQWPVEIKTKVFSFFRPWELLKLSEVCRMFRQVASSDPLWKYWFKAYFPSHDLKLGEMVFAQFKKVFLQIESNWTEMNYSTQSVATGFSWTTKAFLVNEHQIFVEGPHQSFIAYDRSTLHELFRGIGHPGIDLVDFCDDGDYLITRASGRLTIEAEIKIWNKNTGSLISCIPGGINGLVDGDRYLAYQVIGSPNPPCTRGQIAVWNKPAGTLLHVLDTNEGVHTIAADNVHYYAGMRNGTIKTWRKSDGQFLGICKGQSTQPITSLIDGGDTLISGHEDGGLQIWPKQHEAVSSMLAPSLLAAGEVYALHCIHQRLLSHHSRSIQVWNLTSCTLIYAVPKGTTFCCDKDVVYIGTEQGLVNVYHLVSGKVLFQMRCSSDARIHKIVVLSSRLFVLRDSSTTALEVWDLKKRSLLETFDDVGAFHVESDKIILSTNGEVQILDFSTV